MSDFRNGLCITLIFNQLINKLIYPHRNKLINENRYEGEIYLSDPVTVDVLSCPHKESLD